MNRKGLNNIDETMVTHEGVVSKIANNVVTVSLKGNLNCDACNAKSACGISESKSKEIEVYNVTQSLKLNENVEVLLKKDLGLKAVFWAYIFPFALLLTVLLITSTLYEEWIAGLLSIAVLIPYYLMLYVVQGVHFV